MRSNDKLIGVSPCDNQLQEYGNKPRDLNLFFSIMPRSIERMKKRFPPQAHIAIRAIDASIVEHLLQSTPVSFSGSSRV